MEGQSNEKSSRKKVKVETTTQQPISLEELKLRVHHPLSASSYQKLFQEGDLAQPSFSYIPWKFQQSISWGETLFPETSSTSFPVVSFLDLRRIQNKAWADDRLKKGNEIFHLDPTQADKSYQEGIDLVPGHVELLVAQAKLWIHRRNRPIAAKEQLHQVLTRWDANHLGAQELLKLLERRELYQKRTTVATATNKSHLVLSQPRESSAFADALAEKNLLQEDSNEHVADNLLPESDEEHTKKHRISRKESKRKRKSERSKRHRKSHKEKKRRRRKRERYQEGSATDNETDSHTDSSDDASEAFEEDKDHSRRRPKKYSRKRHRCKKEKRNRDDSPSSRSSSQSSRVAKNGHPSQTYGIHQDEMPSRKSSRERGRNEAGKKRHRSKRNRRRRDSSDQEISLTTLKTGNLC